MTTRNNEELDRVKADLANLKTDISDISASLRRLTEQKASQGRERVRKAAADSLEPAERTLHAAEREIEHHPLTSVAASFGIGMLIGKLVSR